MEKSLVREFTGFGNTFFGNTTRNGFVRTFHDGNDLGKSRIQNLPSYKKDDLSKRLDMVVVFQSIQIDRLSVQIQSLRVQLKDSERQLKNYLSYQIQIKQLTEHCMQLQEENVQYKQEIEKMNMICQKLYSEVQQYHHKFDNMDPQIEQKYKNSIKVKQNLQKQIQSMKRSFVQKSQELNNQNKKLTKKVTFQQNQIEKLENKLKQSLQNVNQNSLNEINTLKKIQIQINQKINHLNKQLAQKAHGLQNMKIVVKNKMTEFQQQKSKFLPYGAEIAQKIKRVQEIFIIHQQKLEEDLLSVGRQNQILLKRSFQKDQQLSELRNLNEIQMHKLDKINKQIENQLKQHVNKLQTSQNQIRKISAENGQLTQQLSFKTNQNKQLQNQLKSLRNQFRKDIEIIHRQRQIMQNKLISLLKQFETKNQQLKQSKSMVLQLKEQNQKNLKQKQLHAQSFNVAIQKMEKFCQQYNQQKQIIYQLQLRNADLQSEVKKLQNQNAIYERQFYNCQEQNKQLSNQKDSIQTELQNVNKIYIQTDKKLKESENAYMQEVQNIKSQYQKQVQQIKKSFDQATNHNEILTQQICKLKKVTQHQSSLSNQLVRRLQISQKLLKSIKQKYQTLTNDKRQKGQPIINKLNDLFKINQNFVEKIIKLQDQVSFLENQNLKLQSQKKILNFQMVESHKINTFQKRRDSRTSTDSNSLRSFVNSSSVIKNKQKNDSFIQANSKQPFTSIISQNTSSERRIFAQLNQNRY